MEKIKNWFYKPAFTLICYAIALLIICYFGYTVNISYQSVVSYVEAGSISWGALVRSLLILCQIHLVISFTQ